ncbi:MAG: hypothetical protein WCP85_07130 [Mariniphaga sp.]
MSLAFRPYKVFILTGELYCISTWIFLFCTKIPRTNKLLYCGAIFKNRFLNTYEHLTPNRNIQNCDLGNGNIMFALKSVVNSIVILSDSYTHSAADFSYTLTAKRKKIPVLITPNYCGE